MVADSTKKRGRAAADDAEAKPSEAMAEAGAGVAAATAVSPRSGTSPQSLGYAALAISIVSLVLALTSPIWSPRIYGTPVTDRMLALGVAQLRPAVESDGPYHAELAMMNRLASGDAQIVKALESIAGDSDIGVPTVGQLQSRFSRVATEIMMVDVVDPQKGWMGRAVASVAAVFDPHTVALGLKDHHRNSEIVIRAQAALSAGDLTGTINVMGELSGRSGEIAASWIRAAKARRALTQVMTYLDEVSTARLANKKLVAVMY